MSLRADAWCYLDDIGARYPSELLRLDGHLSEASTRLMAYYCRQGATTGPAEASRFGPFSGVAMPTTALWPWLYDWSDPDAHLDGAGHLRPGTAMDMIRACRRLRRGEQSRRNLRACHLIDPLVCDEEAEDVPDVLTDAEAGFFADLERALCDYLNARPATLGIPEAFAGPGVRLFEPEDLHELVVAFLDGYDVAGRSAVEMLCGHSGDWPNVTNLGLGRAEVPHGWRGEWWMLRDCLYAYWAARSVALDGARTVAP
ncbi:MAG: hypothetical protein ACYCTI_12170, partial [Acidimicrobiales bacterium]